MILLPGTTGKRGSTAPLMVGSHAAWAPARADTTHPCLSLTESSSETTTHHTTGNCSTCSDNSPGHHRVGWMKCPESLVLCLIVNHFAVITFFFNVFHKYILSGTLLLALVKQYHLSYLVSLIPVRSFVYLCVLCSPAGSDC